MLDTRPFVRSALFLAALALLASSACVPPITFHDGLSAWTPEPGRAEGSVGYHRLYWPGGGGGSIWYLTPGVRCGLRQSPLVGDIGLTSVVIIGGGIWAAMLGPALGIGYQTRNFCFVVRPSAYMLSFYSGGVHFRDPLWQVSLLAGNRAQSGKTHISGGCRASKLGGGPVLLVDHSVGPVNLRLEGSYMLQYETYVYGPYSNGQLTVGLTVGGPAPSQSDNWGE
jgi:hypothetical protein